VFITREGAIMRYMKKQLGSYKWIYDLPNWSLLDAKDLAGIFNYKHSKAVVSSVDKGVLPKADKKTLGNRKHKLFWTVATIKKEIIIREKADQDRLLELQNKSIDIQNKIMELQNV
jgi:hypothetical protein